MRSIAVKLSLLGAAVQMAAAAPWSSSSYNGGHNVANSNTNELIDASDATVLLDVLDGDLLKRTRWNQKSCYRVFKSYNGGHNVYNSNKNSLIDLSDLTVVADILDGDRRTHRRCRIPRACHQYVSSYNGGHNVVNTNKNSLVDASGLTAVLNVLDGGDVLKRNGPSYKSVNGGHNVVNSNTNKLIDVSDATVVADVLDGDLGDGDFLKRSTSDFLSDLDTFADVLKRSFVEYDGGHNVENTNENEAVDLSNLGVFADILKRHVKEWNGGHNVQNSNTNKLVDLSSLSVFADVLKRSYDDQDCICRPRPKPKSCNNGWTPPGVHTPRPTHHWHHTPSPTPTRHHHHHEPRPTPGPGSCGDKYVYINKGHNVVNSNKNTLLDLSNLDVDIDILGLDGARTKKSVKGNWVCDSEYGCCGHNAPSCSSGYTYVNEGHNVYNENSNKGIDLSNLTLNLDILGLGGDRQSRVEKDRNYKCQSKWGCCVNPQSSSSSYDGGHNVVNSNSNSLVDASGLNLGLGILGL